MAISWKRVKPLESNTAIEDFEVKYGFSVPEELKKCIRENNGGRPSPKELVNAFGKEFEVKGLLSFNESDEENIYKHINFFIKNYFHSLLPFATTSGDDIYCIKENKVILWTQEDAQQIAVCDSFSDFLTLLEKGIE